MKVAVLGTTGMLGSMTFDYLMTQGLQPVAVNRSQLNAATCHRDEVQHLLGGFDYVLNCMGMVRQVIRLDNELDSMLALEVNTRLPQELSLLNGVVIQPATDCVFNGEPRRAWFKGYDENSPHSVTDIYSETKSFGEVPGLRHLRCSLVGPEVKEYHSLLSRMILMQPQGAAIPGYVNHWWNGITTLHWAKICAGVIKNWVELRPMQHIIPADVMTKYELLKTMAETFNRRDLQIEPVEAPEAQDRRLTTIHPGMNRYLWKAAGYAEPPTISQMIAELWEYVETRASTARR